MEHVRPPKRQIDFIVTTTNPKHDTDGRKRVRSVAAHKSWPGRRKKAFEQLESSGVTIRDESVTTGRVAKRRISKVGPKTWSPNDVVTAGGDHDQASNCSSSPELAIVTPSTTSVRDDGDTLGSFRALYNRLAAYLPRELLSVSDDHFINNDTACCWCAQCRNGGSWSPSGSPVTATEEMMQLLAPISPRRTAGKSVRNSRCVRRYMLVSPPRSPSGGRVDPFNCYPVQYLPWYDQILHHMLKIYCPRGWPALKITADEGFEWEWYMTQTALAEPALFYIRLLFGTGDMVKLGIMPPEYTYVLHAKAVQAMQEALEDPQRATSDAVILAVGRIALYEHMYGNKQASREVHRPAQKRMVELRGGMKSLTTLPRLVKQLMRWSDRIMAVGSDDVRLLEDDEVPNFSTKDTFAAVESWAPHEMPSVRSKINISDLVND